MKKEIFILSVFLFIILFSSCFFMIQRNDIVRFIPGTNVDGSNNYAVSAGNDDYFVTLQSGDCPEVIIYFQFWKPYQYQPIPGEKFSLTGKTL